MRTNKNIFPVVLFSLLLSLSVASCNNNNKSAEQKESCCQKTESQAACCQANDDALIIVATLTVKNEADVAQLEDALRKVVDGTRTEEGNISYVLHQDINNPMSYIIIEAWKSLEAIEFHNATPHFKAFVEAVGDKADLSVHTVKKMY